MIRVFNDGPLRPNAEALRKAGDLRDMHQAKCAGCQNTWWAPTVGRCPKCRHDGPHEILESKMTGAPRV